MFSLQRFAKSSVGSKSLTAVFGLLLFGFLLSHVAGNALLLVPDDGEAYNAYAAGLRDFGPLLWVARVGLFLLFLVHIAFALVLHAKNCEARGLRYEGGRVRAPRSSSAMLPTGLIVLAFLFAHLWHFSLDARFEQEGASLVARTLQDTGIVALYATGIAGLWWHLWHAIPSAFQTLGVAHPRYTRLFTHLSRAAVCMVSLLFLAILLGTFLRG